MTSAIADIRCQLTAYPVGRRFRPDNGLNTLMADIFESIHTATHNTSLPVVRALFCRDSIGFQQPSKPAHLFAFVIRKHEQDGHKEDHKLLRLSSHQCNCTA